MRRHIVDLAVLFVLATVVCAYLALLQPGFRSEVLHAYVLVLGALFMIAVVTATGEAAPRRTSGELERALDERTTPERRLPELERAERVVTLSVASAYDFHHRLAPDLREIAEARLERRGQQLAPDHLGRWWDLLRPDRPPPAEHHGPGISQADLRALVDDLERM